MSHTVCLEYSAVVAQALSERCQPSSRLKKKLPGKKTAAPRRLIRQSQNSEIMRFWCYIGPKNETVGGGSARRQA